MYSARGWGWRARGGGSLPSSTVIPDGGSLTLGASASIAVTGSSSFISLRDGSASDNPLRSSTAGAGTGLNFLSSQPSLARSSANQLVVPASKVQIATELELAASAIIDATASSCRIDLAAGSAATPALNFPGISSNGGLYSDANNLWISSGGAQRAFFSRFNSFGLYALPYLFGGNFIFGSDSSKTASFSIDFTVSGYRVDTSGGALTATLPAHAGTGFTTWLWNEDNTWSGVNTVTIARNGGVGTINGVAASFVVTAGTAVLIHESLGTNEWFAAVIP